MDLPCSWAEHQRRRTTLETTVQNILAYFTGDSAVQLAMFDAAGN